MGRLSNITIKLFRGFLEEQGLRHIRTKGGHEIWARADLSRPIVLQTHVGPMPEFVIRNNLKTIGATIKELMTYIGS
jgi:predicted RNA binding protein YcfA (HicA-like mRNA interferase family)|nr:MAG TPA: HICA protein [Caudoviricetes sp.]